MTRWGMVIDLRKCVGCQTCTITCKQTYNLPPGVFWRRVADCEVGEYPHVQRVFLPMACQHCGDAPCFEVCPTTATYRRADGIVDIHYNLCIGCGYCVVACPYLARTLIVEQQPYFAQGLLPPEQALFDAERLGVCTKCNFCRPRIDDGLAHGLTPGVDFEATPMCVSSCIANALHFGDLDDTQSNISRMVRGADVARMNDQLGTDPAVYYIVE